MIDPTQYLDAVERSLTFLRRLLVVPDGSMGIYDRYRIDLQQINHWIRPDFTLEVARLFVAYGQETGNTEYVDMAHRMAKYALTLQRAEGWLAGSFPFYQFGPTQPDEADPGEGVGGATFPHDNGRIADCLIWLYRQTEDEAYLNAAQRTLDFLLRIQSEDGTFSRTELGQDQDELKGAEYVARPTLALIWGGMGFRKQEYKDAARKGLIWLQGHTTNDGQGRVLTSFETARTDAWRPPSSETAAALNVFALAARFLQEHPWWHSMVFMARTLRGWQDESGAIRNGDQETLKASKQTDPNLTDLVYTDADTLQGFIEAYRTNGDSTHREAAERLANFLISIQCRGESETWDGAWRGSYNLKHRQWAGRANQQNELDEGGMFSAYTGWATAPIAYGLLRLLPPKKKR
jgi:hypothetical protein